MNRFSDLSGPVKAVAILLSGGSLIAAVYALTGGERMFLFSMFGLIAVLGIVVMVYIFAFKLIKKKKSKEFGNEMGKNVRSDPATVLDENERARLEKVRERFLEAVAKFKSNGEDLYSVPWYCVIGEPGSGKTEAIRNSGLKFALKDPQQGAGGTYNIDWWFTEDELILDTAGRLLFQFLSKDKKGADASSEWREMLSQGNVPNPTSEWRELLKLLNRTRKHCPLNGLFLVISSESLIRDSDEDIELKALFISKQLDCIKQELDIRFPVFVLITKCDLIRGFREFFEGIKEKEEQQQMLGWSNEAGRDDEFRPEVVGDRISSVVEKLRARRIALLSEDFANVERRIDAVDTLYGFPDELEKLSDKVEKYMGEIFKGGRWKGKPLFLRGIYFTSSLQEGVALDKQLAEALGTRVDKLPADRKWKKERSYFLKDFYEKKMFQEKHLVTRATNTVKARRKQRIMIVAGAAVLCAFALTSAIVARTSLRDAVLKQSAHWEYAAKRFETKKTEGLKPIGPDVDGGYKLRLEDPMYLSSPFEKVSLPKVTYLEYFTNLKEFADSRIKGGGFLKLFRIAKDPMSVTRRREASQRVFGECVVSPAVEYAQDRFVALGDSSEWTSRDLSAYLALVSMETAISASGDQWVDNLDVARVGATGFLGPLMEFSIGRKSEAQDWAAWDALLVSNFSSSNKVSRVWSSNSLSHGEILSENGPLFEGLKRFVRSVTSRTEFATQKFAVFSQLNDQLVRLDEIEAELRSQITSPNFGDDYTSEAAATDGFERIVEAYEEYQENYQEVDRLLSGVWGDIPVAERKLASVFADQVGSIRSDILSEFDSFRGALSITEASAPVEEGGEAPDLSTPDLRSQIGDRLDSAKEEALMKLQENVDSQLESDVEIWDAVYFTQTKTSDKLTELELGRRVYRASALAFDVGDIDRIGLRPQDPESSFGNAYEIALNPNAGLAAQANQELKSYSGASEAFETVIQAVRAKATAYRRYYLLRLLEPRYRSYLKGRLKFPFVRGAGGVHSASDMKSVLENLEEGIGFFSSNYPEYEKDIWGDLVDFNTQIKQVGESINPDARAEVWLLSESSHVDMFPDFPIDAGTYRTLVFNGRTYSVDTPEDRRLTQVSLSSSMFNVGFIRDPRGEGPEISWGRNPTSGQWAPLRAIQTLSDSNMNGELEYYFKVAPNNQTAGRVIKVVLSDPLPSLSDWPSLSDLN